MGGVFDFDGDGKTSVDEEFIAFKVFEKVSEEDNEDNDDDNFCSSDSSAPLKRSDVKYFGNSDKKTVCIRPDITESLTEENYPKLKCKVKSHIVLTAIVSGVTILFMSIFPIWKLITGLSKTDFNVWSAVISLFFLFGDLWLLYFIWQTAQKKINQDMSDLKKLKIKYQWLFKMSKNK